MTLLMSDPVTIDEIRENLRRAMVDKNLKPTTLSLNVGSSPTLVADIFNKNKDVGIGTLYRLAGALDVDIERLLAKRPVIISGYIGAGGEVIFEDISDDEHADSVPRPPSISGELNALVVRGDSMLPKYNDGDIIYIQRQHDGLLAEYIGEDCAIRLTYGATYLKTIAYGSQKGLFTLRSLNAADMVDVEIEWASPVIFIMPKRARNFGG
jgi:repressor LexA